MTLGSNSSKQISRSGWSHGHTDIHILRCISFSDPCTSTDSLLNSRTRSSVVASHNEGVGRKAPSKDHPQVLGSSFPNIQDRLESSCGKFSNSAIRRPLMIFTLTKLRIVCKHTVGRRRVFRSQRNTLSIFSLRWTTCQTQNRPHCPTNVVNYVIVVKES